MPFFDIFASPRWSPGTAHAHKSGFLFHFFFQELSPKNLRPKMTKIASKGKGCNLFDVLKQLHFHTRSKKFILCSSYVIASSKFSWCWWYAQVGKHLEGGGIDLDSAVQLLAFLSQKEKKMNIERKQNKRSQRPRWDSNPQSSDSKSDAVSIGPRGPAETPSIQANNRVYHPDTVSSFFVQSMAFQPLFFRLVQRGVYWIRHILWASFWLWWRVKG